MMGRQSRQMAMLFVDIESLIPETHLLRKIERMVSFDFIYDLLAPYYPATGRPSVDPVSMFKMLLIGYLYGIKSERRLVEEVQLNIAYRWFCGFELDDTIPNHSTFSKTRTRKWQQSSPLVFEGIACSQLEHGSSQEASALADTIYEFLCKHIPKDCPSMEEFTRMIGEFIEVIPIQA